MPIPWLLACLAIASALPAVPPAVQAGSGTTPAEIRFRAGGQVSGRVTDPRGEAISDVQLMLGDKQGPFLWDARSSEDGSFVFTQLPDGVYELHAEREGYKHSGERREVVVAGSNFHSLNLQLEPVTGATLTGHLLGLASEEIQQVYVSGDGGGSDSVHARVEPDGHYEIKNVEPGDWCFTATTASERLIRQNIKIRPGDTEAVLDFEFGKGGMLSGTILVDGAPLSGACVLTWISGSKDVRSAMSRDDGRFEIQDLTPGHYRLSVTGSLSTVYQERAVEIDGDRATTVDIPMATLTGYVASGGSGEPVADAEVSIDGRENGHIDFGCYSTPAIIRSGEKGAFEVRVSAGKYTIKVQKEGYTPAEATAEVRAGGIGAPVEVRLKPVRTP